MGGRCGGFVPCARGQWVTVGGGGVGHKGYGWGGAGGPSNLACGMYWKNRRRLFSRSGPVLGVDTETLRHTSLSSAAMIYTTLPCTNGMRQSALK